MKRLLLTLFLFSSLNIFACTCGYKNAESNFTLFETSFLAKVVEVKSNAKPMTREIKVEFINIFRGKPTQDIIIILDENCPAPNPVLNSEWLFYASKNKDGILEMHACNPSKAIKPNEYLNKYPDAVKKYEIDVHKQLTILKFLQKNYNKQLNWPSLITNDTHVLSNFLKPIKPDVFENEFGFYLITFNPNKTIKEIKTIQSLGQKLDTIITTFYENRNSWDYLEFSQRDQNFESDIAMPIVIWKNQ